MHGMLLHPYRKWHDEFEQSFTSWHGVPWFDDSAYICQTYMGYEYISRF